MRLAYHGKAYHGWQRQPNAMSVQEVIEHSLSTLLRKEVVIVGAGRTDAGVHAKEMYAHFDTDTPLDSKQLSYRMNAFLPSDIVILDILRVQDNAHARFDAIARKYVYQVVCQKNPFLKELAYMVSGALDVDLMNRAAQQLCNYRDFECFSKSKTDVKTYICSLNEAVWLEKDGVLEFHISADRFLRNMVRAIVGTLLEIGKGQKSIADLDAILQSKSRSRAGVSVPAHGLFLVKVTYPSKIYV